MTVVSKAAVSPPAAEAIAWPGAMARAWRKFLDYRRRLKSIEQLSRLDDRTLADIGLMRGGFEDGIQDAWRERYYRL